MKLKPLKDRVVIKQVEALQKTSSGIVLPNESKEQPQIATVLAVGPEVKEIKVEDQVIFPKYSGTEVEYENEELIIIEEEKLLAVIEQ